MSGPVVNLNPSPFSVIGWGDYTGIRSLTTTVSQRFKAVYAKGGDENYVGLDRLGRFVSGGHLISLGTQWAKWYHEMGSQIRPPDLSASCGSGSSAQCVPDWGHLASSDIWYPNRDAVTDRYRLTHLCELLLLSQNCTACEEQECVEQFRPYSKRKTDEGCEKLYTRINFGPKQWYATRLAIESAKFDRPWVIPDGDITGWIREGDDSRLTDFVPLCVCVRPSELPRQSVANEIMLETHRYEWPSAWKLDKFVPVARVIFTQPREPPKRPGKPGRIIPESYSAARQYVLSNKPDKVIYWSKVNGPLDSTEKDKKEEYFTNYQTVDDMENSQDPPGEALFKAGICPGEAFDLFALYDTWGYRHQTPTEDNKHWVNASPKYVAKHFSVTTYARVVAQLPPK